MGAGQPCFAEIFFGNCTTLGIPCVSATADDIAKLAAAIEAWAERFITHQREKVTDATFTFVAIDEEGRPRPVPVV